MAERSKFGGRTHRVVAGVAVRNAVAEWTLLRMSREGFAVAPVQRQAIEASDSAARKTALQGVIRKLPVAVSLALPSSDMLLRLLDLPPATDGEIGSMVELQMDKISPFPMDQMVIGWEAIRQSEVGLRVVAAAVSYDRLEAFCRPLLAAGLSPTRLDAGILGWWACLQEAGKIPGKGAYCALILDGSSADLLIALDGEPAAFLSLGAANAGDPAAMAEDARFSLESMELGTEVARIHVWVVGDGKDLLQTGDLKAAFGQQAEIRATSEIPSLSEGVARRAAREGGLNLLPAEWREKAASRKIRRRFVLSILGLAAFFLAVFLLVGAVQTVAQRRTAAVREEIQRLEGPAKDVRDLQARLAALEMYGDRKDSVLECLLEVVQAMPEGIELSAFTFRKGATLSLRGQAVAPDPVYDLIQTLQASSRYAEVQAAPVQTRAGSGPMPVQFSITCTFPGTVEHEPLAP